MITMARRNWSMPRGSTLLILLPLLVFGLNSLIDVQIREPAGYFAQPSLQNGAAEAAGRTRAIAAFLLFAGLAIAVLVASASSLRLLERKARKRILIAYFLTVAAGTTMVLMAGAFKGSPYLDQGFACASFSRLHEAGPAGPVRHLTTPPQPSDSARPPRVEPRPLTESDLGWAPGCTAPQFYTLQALIQIPGVLLLFAMPAVIFGAVTCLAIPSAGSAADRFEAWTLQTRRLTGFLYLAAAYMISGLLFTSARLNWIIYSLHPNDIEPFRSYISSIAMHGGISNSLIIASYYLPVATWLAANRPPEPKAARSAGPAAMAREGPTAPDPFAPLKVAITIFAPALVGLFGEFLKLGG